MRFQLIIAASLLLSVACQPEGGSGRKRPAPNPERVRPPASAEIPALFSTIHRDRGARPLTHAEEIIRTLKNDLPAAYRLIPDMEKDDEGKDGRTVISQTWSGRATITCGYGAAFAGVNERIKDCSQKNPLASTWDGAISASSGEGQWQLISFNDRVELWLDVRTGLAWSDVIDQGNWCQAAGNDQQNSPQLSINCNNLMAGKRICNDYSASGVGEINWRLPTRNDYLQADINGLRFALKKNLGNFWTATMQAASKGRQHAWVYQALEGTLAAQELTTSLSVRCVGSPRR